MNETKMATCDDRWKSHQLNSLKCLSLLQIVETFDAPIREAWAWAVAYEGCKAIKSAPDCRIKTALNGIFVHQEGFVHRSSFINNTHGGSSSIADEAKVKYIH